MTMAEQTDILNPFTAEQKVKINDGIKRAELLIQGINKATSAGIETGNSLDEARTQLAQLTRIKNTYFPNG